MDVICLDSSDSEDSFSEILKKEKFKNSPRSHNSRVEEIYLSSDSKDSACDIAKRENFKSSSCSYSMDNDVYSLDENDEANPAIIYESDTATKEQDNPVDVEEHIEDFESPCKQAKLSHDAEDFSINDETMQCGTETKSSDQPNDVETDCLTPMFEEKNDDKVTSENNDLAVKKLVDKNKQKRSKFTQEEREKVRIFKEQKKLERERLREEKRAELLKQRAQKAALTENQRNLKPEENIKFLKVHIDNEIINSVCGGNIISLLQQNSIQYVVESQVMNYTITWSKRRIKKVVEDNGEVLEKIESSDEEQLLYVLDWQKAVELVHNNDLLSHVETVKSAYINKNLTLIIYGLGKYFDYKKSKRNHLGEFEGKKSKPKPSDRVFEDAPDISKDDLEVALINLQLLGGHNSRLIETPEELSSLVFNFTKSLSQIDIKLERQKRQEGDFEWYAKGDSSQCVKVDKNGEGLLRLWQQQLCQFNSVGFETAQAIISQFNSPAGLVHEYEKCATQEEAELLLQNIQIRRNAGILSSFRRVGPQLSKKIYNFFMKGLADFEL